MATLREIRAHIVDALHEKGREDAEEILADVDQIIQAEDALVRRGVTFLRDPCIVGLLSLPPYSDAETIH